MANTENHTHSQQTMAIRGELARRLWWAPFRVLSIVTGFFLVRGVISLVLRYGLFLRRYGMVRLEGSSLVLDTEWWILGKRFRRVRTVAPVRELSALRFENRQRYIHLLMGFGALAVGTWIGIQWFVDGLRAGYPYLAMLGAVVIVLGIAVDLILYLFVPGGGGQSRLVLAMGPWTMRVCGVEYEAAQRLLEQLGEKWETG